ncbi:MAG: DinB family protein [Actinomycetota bacterium]|nr:DinB family protein [Actinomycetota bacterium]
MTPDDRAELPREARVLLTALANQREHVLGAVDGLSGDALRRPVLPSSWSCLGLVQHLALDVERFWFRGVVAGEDLVIRAVTEGTDDAWQVATETPAEQVLEAYRREARLADAVIASTPLDAQPGWWPDFFGDYRLDDLRAVLVHVLTETACHAGHLDAARELVDGKQWLVLTE